MTLKELKQAVGTPKKGINYQTIRKTGTEFIKATTDGAEITVYTNGYITYRAGHRTATFPINVCGDYVYRSSDGSETIILEEEFLHDDWRIRVVLEGESRIELNQKIETIRNELGSSYGDDAETKFVVENFDESGFIDPSPSCEEKHIEKEEIETLYRMIDLLVPNQQKVLKKYYWERKDIQTVAHEMKRSAKSIRNVKYLLLEQLRREYEKEFGEK